MVQVEKVEGANPLGVSPAAVPVVRRLRGRGFNSLRREATHRRRQANIMVVASLFGLAGLVMLLATLLR